MLEFLAPLVSAGASLFAGKKQEKANAAAREQDYQRQKEFAQSGITWKVEDAKRAGIHPAVALGAQPASFSPIGVGDTGTQHLAQAGQDLSRAIDTTRTASSRISAFDQTVQSLTIQKMGLENELLASQVAKTKQQVGPPMAGDDYLIAGQTASGIPHRAVAPQKTQGAHIAGNNWLFNPGWTDSQTMEDRYGEITDYVYGPAVIGADADYNRRMRNPVYFKNFYNKINYPNMRGWRVNR